ncbi:MAG: GntR family transcriptional regulator [Deltaproteobacteria bacterium]
MWFNINPASSIPIYMQLINEVKAAVARGVLAPGERMPTVRDLACSLGINPLTISKAYQKLEQEGVLMTMRSRGTFVAEKPTITDNMAKLARVREMLERVLIEAYHAGVTPDEVKILLEESIQDLMLKGGNDQSE